MSDVCDVAYTLQAVAVHRGRYGGGHYVAYVRDGGGRWLFLDDEELPRVVSFEAVQQAQAYLLLFHLQGSVR